MWWEYALDTKLAALLMELTLQEDGRCVDQELRFDCWSFSFILGVPELPLSRIYLYCKSTPLQQPQSFRGSKEELVKNLTHDSTLMTLRVTHFVIMKNYLVVYRGYNGWRDWT